MADYGIQPPPRPQPGPRRMTSDEPRPRRRNRFDIFDEEPARPARETAPEVQRPNRFAIFDEERPQAMAPTVAVEHAPEIDFSAPYADVRRQISNLPEEHRKEALDRWADAVVAKERKGGPSVAQTADDYVRRAATGIVGGWGDRLGAGLSSLAGADYDEALAHEQAKSRAATRNTAVKVGIVPESVPFIHGDWTTGDLAGVGGGIAGAAVAPVWARQGASMVGNALRSAATGAAYGGVVGYGSGDTPDERMAHAANGAMYGAAFGGAAPFAGAAIGNAAQWAYNRLSALPNGLANYGREAVDRIAKVYDMDRQPANTAQYGDEGMLADQGGNLQELTGGLAASPGPSKKMVEDAILDRRREASRRIEQTIDTTLGRPQNLVDLEERATRAAQANARPHYDQFRQSQIPITQNLVDIIHSVPEPIVREAVKMARGRRIDVTRPENFPSLVDYIKRGLDDEASVARRKGNTNGAATWGKLSEDLRNEVDSALSPHDPAQSPWALGRAASGEGKTFSEGLAYGGRVLDNGSRGVHPDQLAADLRGQAGTPFEAGVALGVRGDIRNTMGSAGAAYGANGDIAILKDLNAPFNQQKMAQIVGHRAAADIASRAQAEAAFNQTYSNVLRNSRTENKKSIKDMIPNVAPKSAIDATRGIDATNLPIAGAKKLIDIISRDAATVKNTRMITDMADMLIAQGARREEIVRGLRDYLRHGQVAAAARPRIAQAITAILRSGAQSAVGNDYARQSLPEFRITPNAP